MERIFDLDMQFVVDACILAFNMFLLFLIGSYLLYNPVRAFLEKRKNMIKENIEKAETDKEEAAKLKSEYEKKLKEIDKEAEVILSDARKKALLRENQIIAEAKEEAEKITARAHNEAELEKKAVQDDVKKEIINVASVLAGKVVSASIDTNVQDYLVEETLNEMGDSTWRS